MTKEQRQRVDDSILDLVRGTMVERLRLADIAEYLRVKFPSLKAPAGHRDQKYYHHRIADRALQRLRKQGHLQYHDSRGWNLK